MSTTSERVEATRRRRVLAIVAVVSLLLSACSGSAHPSGPSARPAATTEVAAGFVDVGRGFAVDAQAANALAAHAVDATGQGARDLPRWQRLSPVFDVTVRHQPAQATRVAVPLSGPAPAGAVVVVLTRHSAADPWQPLVATLSPDRRAAIVSAPHFSFFTALLAPATELLTQTRTLLEGFLSGAVSQAQAPSCPRGGDGATGGWQVRESGKSALAWCMDASGNGRVLRVVNTRRYPLLLRHPGAAVAADSQAGLVKLISDRTPGYHGAVLLPPREGVTFILKGSATVRSEFDGLAQSLVAFSAAFDAASLVLPKAPNARYAKAWELAKLAAEDSKCVAEMVSGDVMKMIPACLSGAVLEAAYGAWGAVLAVMLTTTALLEFLRSELNAAGDQLNGRDVTTLAVTAPSLPSPRQQAQALADQILTLGREFDSNRMRALTRTGRNDLADDLDANQEAVTTGDPCRIWTSSPLSCEAVVVIGPLGPANTGFIYRFEFGQDGAGRVYVKDVVRAGDAG